MHASFRLSWSLGNFKCCLSGHKLPLGRFCVYKSTLVNLGGWTGVGAAAQITATADVFSGVRSLSPAEGVFALERIMLSNEVQVGVSKILDSCLLKSMFPQGNFLDEIAINDLAENRLPDKYDQIIDSIKKSSSIKERIDRIQTYIETILKQTLSLSANKAVDIDQDLFELGVDSLLAMEMANRLQLIMDEKGQSIISLQENRTVRALCIHFANSMELETSNLGSVAELIQQDVVLHHEIKAANIRASSPSEFKIIMLTGVTGHLGIHCLIELVKFQNHLTVICLIRGKSDTEVTDRLLKTLQEYKARVNMKNIKVVAADLAKDQLGLTPDAYDRLAEDVDAILHCAAKTNHLESYSDGSTFDMRTHNVFALINILKLASRFKTKPILYTSSLPAATKIMDSGLLDEEFPESSELGAQIKSGYILSKLVGEKLIGEAMVRGIPAKVIRLPFIFGNSETGYIPRYNHAWAVLISSIRVKMIPAGLNGTPIIAANSAAKIIINLFFSNEAENGVYNLTVASAPMEDVFAEVLDEHSIKCEVVMFRKWRDAVFEKGDEKMLGPIFWLYADDGEDPRIFSLHPLFKELKNINLSDFSPKMKKNVPGVSELVVAVKDLISRHLRVHFGDTNIL